MSERLHPDNSGNQEKKTFKEKIRNSKLLAAIQDHTPAAVFAIGLAETAHTGDIRSAAFGGGLYFAHKYYEENIAPQIEAYREEKQMKKLEDSLPENVRNEVSSMGVDNILRREALILENHNSSLNSSIIYDYELIGEVAVSNGTLKDEEGDLIEDIGARNKIVFSDKQSHYEFTAGVLIAQYLLRTKYVKGVQFPAEQIDAYNTEIERGGNREGGIPAYMQTKPIRDKDILGQFDRFTRAYINSNEFVEYGGIYLLGLYESQQEIAALNEQFNRPPHER